MKCLVFLEKVFIGYMFLSNKKQFVKATDEISTDMVLITCGVPQDSILGPLAFYFMLMTYHLIISCSQMMLNFFISTKTYQTCFEI